MKRTIGLFSILLLVGCSSIVSIFDDTYLVWKNGMDIKKAETPKGFTISPQEVYQLRPLTKYSWNIYADNSNYYISSGIQKVVGGDNSALAKKNGFKIPGNDRKLYNKLINAKGERKHLSMGKMREIIKNHNKD